MRAFYNWEKENPVPRERLSKFLRYFEMNFWSYKNYFLVSFGQRKSFCTCWDQICHFFRFKLNSCNNFKDNTNLSVVSLSLEIYIFNTNIFIRMVTDSKNFMKILNLLIYWKWNTARKQVYWVNLGNRLFSPFSYQFYWILWEKGPGLAGKINYTFHIQL